MRRGREPSCNLGFRGSRPGYTGRAHMTSFSARLVLVVEDESRWPPAGEVPRDAWLFGCHRGNGRRRARSARQESARRGRRRSPAQTWIRARRSRATPADVPVIIFSGVPSESAELERLRPRTRLIEKPYSLVLLVETLEEMLSETKAS